MLGDAFLLPPERDAYCLLLEPPPFKWFASIAKPEAAALTLLEEAVAPPPALTSCETPVRPSCSSAWSVYCSIRASTSGLSYLLSLYLRERTVFCWGRVPLCADYRTGGWACCLVGLSAAIRVLELLLPAPLRFDCCCDAGLLLLLDALAAATPLD